MRLPKRYIPKHLTKKDLKKQKIMIKRSNNMYKKGKYYTRKKLRSFKSKPSTHVINAKRVYNTNIISYKTP